MKICLFDTETTGLLEASMVDLDKQPEIIELGAVFIEDGEVTAELTQLLKPKIKELPKIITKITGITDADLVGKPSFKDYYEQLKNFMNGADFLICHNASFDTGMLRVELERLEATDFPWPKHTICTVQEYKRRMGKWAKMVELYQMIMGKELEQTHRALDDCHKLHEILVKDNFYDTLKESYDTTQD